MQYSCFLTKNIEEQTVTVCPSTKKYEITKKMFSCNSLSRWLSLLFSFVVFFVDSLNLIANQLKVVAQLLNLAVHLVDERITLL